MALQNLKWKVKFKCPPGLLIPPPPLPVALQRGIFEVGYLNCIDSSALCSQLRGLFNGGTFLLEDGLIGLERSPREDDFSDSIVKQHRNEEHVIFEKEPREIAYFAFRRMAPMIHVLTCEEFQVKRRTPNKDLKCLLRSGIDAVHRSKRKR